MYLDLFIIIIGTIAFIVFICVMAMMFYIKMLFDDVDFLKEQNRLMQSELEEIQGLLNLR